MVAVACASQSGRLRTSGGGGGVGARCSWTGGRGNLARNCARRSWVFSRNVFVDSMSGEWVPNWANLPIKSSHSRIDLEKSSSIALFRVGGVLLLPPAQVWGASRARLPPLPRWCKRTYQLRMISVLCVF